MSYKYQLRYLVIPDFVFQDDRLTRIAQNVYGFINTYNGESFYFNNPNLSQMFKCSESAIDKAIAQLKELKYIKTVHKIKAGGGKLRFVINLRSVKQYASEVPSSTLRVEATEVPSSTLPNEAKLASPKDNIKDNNIKEKFFEKTSKEQRPLKRSSAFGSYPARPQYTPKPVKKGNYAEDLA